jgi:hypothetical protein
MTSHRRLSVGFVCFLFAICLCISYSFGQARENPYPPGIQRPLSEILNPDGTLKLGAGVQGSFDPRGFQMVPGPGGVPTFAPIGAAPQAEGREIPTTAGDESWDGQFGILTPNGPVRAIAVSGTDVYMGGEFTLAAGVPANNIVKWNGTFWSALGPGTNGTVYVITVSGTDVYAGGAFTTPFPHIAKFNTTLGFWQPLGSGVGSSVYAITVSGTNVYVGGYFLDAGGVTAADRIALWNGSTWSALGSGLNGGVQAIAVSGTDVYAGGYFLNAGGVAAADYIAKWNGTTWSALGSSVNGAVLALAASETDVYAGGDFSMAGGISAGYIAKWNGTAWSALGSGLNYYPNVIAAKGRDVYVGGLISQAGGIWLNCIAKWNGTAWSALGSGADNQVFAITMSGRYVYVGGYFQNTGGKTSHHFGRWIEPLAVVLPNGGESWDAGSSHAITWSADASVGPVKIEYSINNGSTWGTVVASTANTGTYSWTVPNAPSATCRVRISEAADGDPVDTSDGAFTIAGFQVTSPTSTDYWTVGTQRTIAWNTVGSFPTVRLELSTNNGASWGTITASTANTGSYVWTVAGAISSQAIIRVSDSADGVPYDDSPLFSIYPVLVLTMTSPNGGESWEAGSAHAITWSAPSVGPVRIEYSTNNGSTWAIVAASTANTGSYSWTVPATPSASCTVRISEAYDGEPLDTSDGVFTIVGLRVTSPNGGESWGVGSSHSITWETLGSYPTVRIELSTDAGVTWETLTSSTANTGSFPWTVPDAIGGSCLIRVSEATDGLPSDRSDSYFSIYNPPMIRVLSPNGGESWLAGSTHDITWTSSGVTSLVRISYSTNNGASFSMAGISPNDGSYSWILPSVISSECLVRISDFNVLTVDTSDAVFSIVSAQTITVTAPNGGESWATGSIHEITWTQVGLSESVTVDLYKGGVLSKILGTAAATAGAFSWTIGAGETTGPDYRIRVWQGSVLDQSNADFAIVRYPKRVDFNKDDQEDILWRYYGSGGYNRAWFLGDIGESGIPLPTADTRVASAPEKYIRAMLDMESISNPKDRPEPKITQDLMASMNSQRDGEAAVNDPRLAGGRIPEGFLTSVADPRYVKFTVAAKTSSDTPAQAASVPTLLGGADVMPVGDLSWQIVGTGDFNNDTNVDILWRNASSGSNVVWLMNGPEWSASVELIPVADPNWLIVGTGDFNYDGHVDILWRNSASGSNVVWCMSGTVWIESAVLLGVSDLSWRIVGTGDFNGDGYVDILWRYNGAGGYVVVWYMDPEGWTGSAELIPVGDLTWEIKGTGDYNNDGYIDILWRYNGAGGYNVIWYMEGVAWKGGGSLIPVADLTWRIVSR